MHTNCEMEIEVIVEEGLLVKMIEPNFKRRYHLPWANIKISRHALINLLIMQNSTKVVRHITNLALEWKAKQVEQDYNHWNMSGEVL